MLAVTFSHLSGKWSIPSRKNAVSGQDPIIESFCLVNKLVLRDIPSNIRYHVFRRRSSVWRNVGRQQFHRTFSFVNVLTIEPGLEDTTFLPDGIQHTPNRCPILRCIGSKDKHFDRTTCGILPFFFFFNKLNFNEKFALACTPKIKSH